MVKQPTQRELVYQHMVNYGSINCSQAWRIYGIAALHSRIADLRKEGIRIAKDAITYQDRAGRTHRGFEYRLAPEGE